MSIEFAYSFDGHNQRLRILKELVHQEHTSAHVSRIQQFGRELNKILFEVHHHALRERNREGLIIASIDAEHIADELELHAELPALQARIIFIRGRIDRMRRTTVSRPQ